MLKNIHERTVKKVKGNHYIASRGGRDTVDLPYAQANRGYSTDGEDSQRAPSDRTVSEYTVANERATPQTAPSRKSRSDKYQQNGSGPGGGPRSLSSPPTRAPPRAPSALSYDHGGETGSDIYVTSAAYKAPSEISRYSVHRNHQPSRGPRSVYSVASTAKTGRSSRRHGAKIEAMSAPNPFCPNVKGVCCLMLLLNLGLILVTLGFVIVMQFVEPLFVWILGVVFLIFGFATLIGSMIYCVIVCRDAKTPEQLRNEDLYWTKHWQKSIGYTPHEIDYKTDRFDERDRYSDRFSVSKMSGKYSDRDITRY
ncbi:uncharacterized protein LOC129766116 [Toxorhynchites rutilus septentrionalis]|uniref:uncharacterized protein LOC129766116 n=1 Tax=Toxorhynchites rutilus septentrionalis TaxID=329112 RepID=UPI0024784FA4|nr:uncharacterized protein LOC129766116 [Toxorhynchites rutilus septentrionalis]XP_055622549.1 uncharacterized protein LOC129766116 [Toxorhynchites rutilus septentrionalis]XP_055622550.1 uncharacterized protein LOC129766116 [Toxorhynchites rutilus septentrionalis]XP_055622552.1 uncharacterized protein LOC129766116 [Toxorhynchites rutilus septentrionalis]XP_055622553.1 uncharacterized protein LOC129766116 [Toxorhynchites rutilus septentrionalis]XP_055622554.1 uncharacterized protein LOC12976611